MSNNALIPQSKLPGLGTTIFTQMSARRSSTTPLTFRKGFRILTGGLFAGASGVPRCAGANQYAPMTGVQALREAIADKTAELYGHKPDANSEITVTAGATEALYAAITALVRAGMKSSALIRATTAMRLRLNSPAAW